MAFKKGYTPWNKGKKCTFEELYGDRAEFMRRLRRLHLSGRSEEKSKEIGRSISKAKLHFYSSEENRRKISGVGNSFFGKTHSIETRKFLAMCASKQAVAEKAKDPDGYRIKKRKAGLASVSVNQARRGRTDIEEIVYRILSGSCVDFEEQVTIGWYVVDFLAGWNVVIEAYGRYWHERQRSRDLVRRRWLESKGFIVLSYYDDTIKSRDFLCRLLRHLKMHGVAFERCGALDPVMGEP